MNRAKIVIGLPPGSASTAELLWARIVGVNRFELENVPIWAYGLAYGDTIQARTGPDGRKYFDKVLTPSGLLTVRAAGPEADPKTFDEVVELLKSHAVATEKYSKTYAAFAMDPTVFAKIESAVDDLTSEGSIHIEIANDDCESEAYRAGLDERTSRPWDEQPPHSQ